MTMQSVESEKLKCAANISYALAAEITDLLKLREALQTAKGSERAQLAKPQGAGRVRKKLNREPSMARQLRREMRAKAS